MHDTYIKLKQWRKKPELKILYFFGEKVFFSNIMKFLIDPTSTFFPIQIFYEFNGINVIYNEIYANQEHVINDIYTIFYSTYGFQLFLHFWNFGDLIFDGFLCRNDEI